MSKRRRVQPHHETLDELERQLEALAVGTSIARLVDIDDAIYAPGGILTSIIHHPDKETLVKEVLEHAGTGTGVREALFAIATREFGMEPIDLGKAVPGLLSPMTDPGLAESFYMDDIRHRLRQDHAIILSSPDTLSVTELAVRDGDPGDSDHLVNVIVGVVPWSYALLVRKTENLRMVLGLKESSSTWMRGITFDLHLDEEKPFVRTMELPMDPAQADELFRWLFFDVIHPRLFPPPDLAGPEGGKPPLFNSWLGHGIGRTPGATREGGE